MKYIKKYKIAIGLIILALSFFSVGLTVTWDSAHYLSYVEIFEKVKNFSSWDIVRGPIFPLFIYISNILFGKNAVGLLCMMFIVYLLYCYIIIQIAKKIFIDVKYKKVFSFIFVMFSILNPVVFGYFHTLLTEFLSILIMLCSCYISWKWIDIEDKKEKIIYCLLFIFLLPFSYFLKQPYISCILVPMILASIFAIIKNHSFHNITYRIGTFVLSCVFLVSSIVIWNHILVVNNVQMNNGRDSSSLLKNQLLDSIISFKTSTISKYSEIKNEKSLSKNELKRAKKYLKEKTSILLINVYDNKKLLESDFIPLKNNNMKMNDIAKEMLLFSTKHPALLAKSYSKNYCALSSICVIKTSDGVQYWISNEKDYLNLFENNTIAYRFLNGASNIFYLSPEKYESAKYYEQVTDVSLTTKIISVLKYPTNIIYKLTIIIMPIILLLTIIIRLIIWNTLEYYNMYKFGIVFLASSFLTLIACSMVGQIIDRYSVYCFITGLIGELACIFFIIKNIRHRIKDRSH